MVFSLATSAVGKWSHLLWLYYFSLSLLSLSRVREPGMVLRLLSSLGQVLCLRQSLLLFSVGWRLEWGLELALGLVLLLELASGLALAPPWILGLELV